MIYGVVLVFTSQLHEEKRNTEQLKSDLQFEKSKSQGKYVSLQQTVSLLKEEVDLVKKELEEAQEVNQQFKSEIQRASDELDRAKHVREDQTTEVCTVFIKVWFMMVSDITQKLVGLVTIPKV